MNYSKSSSEESKNQSYVALVSLLCKLGLESTGSDKLIYLMMSYHSRQIMRQLHSDMYVDTAVGSSLLGLSETVDST